MSRIHLGLGVVVFLGCSPNGEVWSTYHSEELGFRVDHPPGWKVHESTDERSPVVSFYEPASWDEPPKTPHASEERGFVAIFPRGLGTEGVFGETGDVALDLNEELDRETSKHYTLRDGETWAWFLELEDRPASGTSTVSSGPPPVSTIRRRAAGAMASPSRANAATP